ncbi:MAG TPA: hypothetical protein VJB16_01095, partial [archaeon]|nr:hypothetical protein [archaeon]
YELIVGRVPFYNVTSMLELQQLVRDPRVDVLRNTDGVVLNDDLQRLLRSMMARDSKLRVSWTELFSDPLIGIEDVLFWYQRLRKVRPELSLADIESFHRASLDSLTQPPAAAPLAALAAAEEEVDALQRSLELVKLESNRRLLEKDGELEKARLDMTALVNSVISQVEEAAAAAECDAERRHREELDRLHVRHREEVAAAVAAATEKAQRRTESAAQATLAEADARYIEQYGQVHQRANRAEAKAAELAVELRRVRENLVDTDRQYAEWIDESNAVRERAERAESRAAEMTADIEQLKAQILDMDARYATAVQDLAAAEASAGRLRVELDEVRRRQQQADQAFAQQLATPQ